jgi:hypothetical protein
MPRAAAEYRSGSLDEDSGFRDPREADAKPSPELESASDSSDGNAGTGLDDPVKDADAKIGLGLEPVSDSSDGAGVPILVRADS